MTRNKKIDRAGAVDLQPVVGVPANGAGAHPQMSAPTAPAAPAEGLVPMPTIENDAPFVFRPEAGIDAASVFEIALMYVIHLTNSPVQVEKGALRNVPLPAHRHEQLSDVAQRYLKPLVTQ
jgi:hypothetical protein